MVATLLAVTAMGGVACGQSSIGDLFDATTLTVEQARRLADIHDDPGSVVPLEGYGLTLDKLTTISPEVARELSRSVEGVYLNALPTLSVEAARELARAKGMLSLEGMKALPPGVAKALMRHDGGLDLSGLTTLSDEDAMALGQHVGELDLRGLKTLSDEAARALGQHEGSLSLNVKTLSDQAVASLARHQGELCLGGLTALSEAAATALAAHRGTLRVTSVETLSDEAAMTLARHSGKVSFTSLGGISLEAAMALKANPEIVLPSRLDPMRLRALQLEKSGDIDGAIRMFGQWVAAHPGRASYETEFGELLLRAKRPRDALPHFDRALELEKIRKPTKHRLGRIRALTGMGETRAAAAEFEKLVADDPDNPEVLDEFAWMLAINKDASIRNGRRALELATKACELTNWKNALYVSSVAAAHAELGDFEWARKRSRQAIDLTEPGSELRRKLEQELASYERGEPWRP